MELMGILETLVLVLYNTKVNLLNVDCSGLSEENLMHLKIDTEERRENKTLSAREKVTDKQKQTVNLSVWITGFWTLQI